MINEYLRAQLMALGDLALHDGYVKGLDPLHAGLELLAVAAIGLFMGTLLAARIIVPGHSTEAAMLTVAWPVLGVAFLAARDLGHVEGPGPVAALGTFVLGLMLSATHFVLKTSWPVSLLIIGLCGGFGGLFGYLLADALRLLNAI